MMLLLVGAMLAVVIGPVYCFFSYRHHRRLHCNSSTYPRLIIEGKRLSPHGHQNQLTQLQSRAYQNQRLCVVFGIDNAFTSHDEIYESHFVKQAGNLISLQQTAWDDLSDITCKAARHSIEHVRHGHSKTDRIHLRSLVQTLTMRVSLRVLFRMDEEALTIPDDYLLNLANAINDAWISSKTSDGATLLRFEDNVHLKEAISMVFPKIETANLDPGENPLNLILPGFETMWRVVLRAFIETGYISSPSPPPSSLHINPEWRDILASFAGTPTKTQFKKQRSDDHLSAEMLVKEALRLYPPTRRVHRTFQFPDSEFESGSRSETPRADIEASQTAENIWGLRAAMFYPGRWRKGELTQKQRDAFLPFGSKPFVCPATNFGPMVIALVVGVMFTELGDGWTLGFDGSGGMEGLRSGGRLSNERDAYGDLNLVRCGGMYS